MPAGQEHERGRAANAAGRSPRAAAARVDRQRDAWRSCGGANPPPRFVQLLQAVPGAQHTLRAALPAGGRQPQRPAPSSATCGRLWRRRPLWRAPGPLAPCQRRAAGWRRCSARWRAPHPVGARLRAPPAAGGLLPRRSGSAPSWPSRRSCRPPLPSLAAPTGRCGACGRLPPAAARPAQPLAACDCLAGRPGVGAGGFGGPGRHRAGAGSPAGTLAALRFAAPHARSASPCASCGSGSGQPRRRAGCPAGSAAAVQRLGALRSVGRRAPPTPDPSIHALPCSSLSAGAQVWGHLRGGRRAHRGHLQVPG